jgi:hypothetical protein
MNIESSRRHEMVENKKCSYLRLAGMPMIETLIKLPGIPVFIYDLH